MNFEILKTITMITIIIGSLLVIIMSIIDIIKSNKYWKHMEAELELFKTSLHKEHDLLKKVQEYGEWLEFYHKTMFTNLELENSEFNDGTLTAAGDCLGEFLNTMEDYFDGEESSD